MIDPMLTNEEFALMRELDNEEFQTEDFETLHLAFPCAQNLKNRGLIRAGITSIALTEQGEIALKKYYEGMKL